MIRHADQLQARQHFAAVDGSRIEIDLQHDSPPVFYLLFRHDGATKILTTRRSNRKRAERFNGSPRFPRPMANWNESQQQFGLSGIDPKAATIRSRRGAGSAKRRYRARSGRRDPRPKKTFLIQMP